MSRRQKATRRFANRFARALLTGGDQGPSFVAGNPEASLLIKAVRHEDELKMPPTKKLAKEQIADLTQVGPHGRAVARCRGCDSRSR